MLGKYIMIFLYLVFVCTATFFIFLVQWANDTQFFYVFEKKNISWIYWSQEQY